jgi:hypothetical protein
MDFSFLHSLTSFLDPTLVNTAVNLAATGWKEALAAIFVVTDDIGIIAGSFSLLAAATKHNIKLNGLLERRTLRQIRARMFENRVKIQSVLALGFGIGATLFASSLPLLSGAVLTGTCLWLSPGCTKELFEHGKKIYEWSKEKQPFSRLSLSALNKLFPEPVQHYATWLKRTVSNAEAHAKKPQYSEITKPIVENAATKDKGLVAELSMVSISAGLAYPAFKSTLASIGPATGAASIAGHAALATGAFAVPLFGAGLLTLAGISAAVWGINSLDNAGHALSKFEPTSGLGKGMKVLGNLIPIALGPIGAVLLTGIFGEMGMNGLKMLGEFLPGLSAVPSAPALGHAATTATSFFETLPVGGEIVHQLIAGIAFGGIGIGAAATVKGVSKFVTALPKMAVKFLGTEKQVETPRHRPHHRSYEPIKEADANAKSVGIEGDRPAVVLKDIHDHPHLPTPRDALMAAARHLARDLGARLALSHKPAAKDVVQETRPTREFHPTDRNRPGF